MHAAANRSSDRPLFAASILIILGRLGLAIAICYGLLSIAFQYPLKPIRVSVALSLSLGFLLAAACLLRAYVWLVDIVVQCIALGALLLGVVVVRLYFHRTPHFVTSYEISALGMCLLGFGLSVLWLRRRRRKSWLGGIF
jgi:hypothetical protein